MKDSQLMYGGLMNPIKYIKANNERFSTSKSIPDSSGLSISRRIMKDSQREELAEQMGPKYIKANNERFSTVSGS